MLHDAPLVQYGENMSLATSSPFTFLDRLLNAGTIN